jgi:Transposase DDE domain group 1
LFRQAEFGRLAGYEDVNDAERLAPRPAMRAIVGRDGLDRPAASSSQMARFETEWLATDANMEALTDLSGLWIDRVHAPKPPGCIILDMDSSESPTHGEQEGSGYNGHVRRGRNLGEAKGIVEFAVSEQTAVRGHPRPVEFELDPAIESGSQRGFFGFTRRVLHDRAPWLIANL